MDAPTRKRVTDRAHATCEYCGLPQSAVPAIRFHIEHILAMQHGGKAELENLALACPNCNWHKGPNMSGLDPDTGRTEQLFNPRTQNWSEHFDFAVEFPAETRSPVQSAITDLRELERKG